MTAQTTQPASLPWLEKLIAFPTISGTSNLELIELIEAEFARYGGFMAVSLDEYGRGLD